jgi:3-hydroxyisobutyrate dehydrogenase
MINTTIAFLGLGLMGDPIAYRIATRLPGLRVWNRTALRASQAVTAGATRYATALEMVKGADVIFLCLLDEGAVGSVLFGHEGMAPNLSPHSIIVDLSTIGPHATRRLAKQLADISGASWVDAPLTGGVAGAETGSLVALCGGNDVDIENIIPLLTLFAKRIERLGALGAGQAAKICNQLIVSINLLAIAEAHELARQNGIDPVRLSEALAGGWADSLPLQLLGPRIAQRIVDPKVVSIGTFAKDVRLAMCNNPEIARMPLLAQANEIYEAALAGGLSDVDIGLLGDAIALANSLTRVQ